MIVVLAEKRTVWRSAVGRRGRLTRRAAYLDAAWEAWRAKYPCDCDHEVGYRCGFHSFAYSAEERAAIDSGEMGAHEPPMAQVEFHERRRKVMARLARWLMWRDARRAEMVCDELEDIARAGGARL